MQLDNELKQELLNLIKEGKGIPKSFKNFLFLSKKLSFVFLEFLINFNRSFSKFKFKDSKPFSKSYLRLPQHRLFLGQLKDNFSLTIFI